MDVTVYANPIVRFYFPFSYMTFTVFICFAYGEEPSHLSTMESTRFLYDHPFSPPFGYG